VFYDALSYSVSSLDSETAWTDKDGGTSNFTFKAGSGYAFAVNSDDGTNGPYRALCKSNSGDDSYDFTVCASIKIPSALTNSERAGFFFRYVDSDNYLLAIMDPDTNKIQLRKMVSGTETLVSEAAFTCDDGGFHILKLVVFHDTFLLSADGTLLYEADSGITFNRGSTVHGIYNSRSSGATSTSSDSVLFNYYRYDNFRTTLNDNFTGSGDLTAHVPDTALVGAEWHGAAYEIDTVYAARTATGDDTGDDIALAVIDSGVDVSQDCCVMRIQSNMQVAVTVGGKVGIVFRYFDSSNYYVAYRDSVNDVLVLQRVTGGEATTIGSYSVTVGGAESGFGGLAIYDDGSTIIVSGGDAGLALITATDETLFNDQTRVGLYSAPESSGWSTSGSRHDYLTVKYMGPEPALVAATTTTTSAATTTGAP